MELGFYNTRARAPSRGRCFHGRECGCGGSHGRHLRGQGEGVGHVVVRQVLRPLVWSL